MVRRLIWRIGHRGAFLAFLALLDILYGYSILAAPAPVTMHIDLLLPLQTWGLVWLGVGIAVATGIMSRHDRLHFGLAAALKTAWAAAWLKVWIFESVPRSWVSVIIWAAFAAIVLVVSSWPETRKRDVTGISDRE